MKFLHIRARRDDWHQGVRLFIFSERGNNGGEGVGAIGQLVMTAIPEDSPMPLVHESPGIRIDPTTTQELMDSLWDCGFRPSEGTGSAGQLASTQKHLEDMRYLAFKHLNTQLPEERKNS